MEAIRERRLALPSLWLGFRTHTGGSSGEGGSPAVGGRLRCGHGDGSVMVKVRVTVRHGRAARARADGLVQGRRASREG